MWKVSLTSGDNEGVGGEFKLKGAKLSTATREAKRDKNECLNV